MLEGTHARSQIYPRMYVQVAKGSVQQEDEDLTFNMITPIAVQVSKTPFLAITARSISDKNFDTLCCPAAA